jgi:hypothetical protein
MNTSRHAPTCAACNRAGHRIQRCPEIARLMNEPTLSEAIATALTGTPDPVCCQCGKPAFASVSRQLLCRDCY